MHRSPFPILLFFAVTLLCNSGIRAEVWTVPLAGNIYRTAPAPGGGNFGRGGVVPIQTNETYSAFVAFNRPTKASLSLAGKTNGKPQKLSVRIGDQQHSVTFSDATMQTMVVGDFQVAQPGYVQIDFEVAEQGGDAKVELSDLKIESDEPELLLDFVRNNDGNMFYWGRRGPSVHLGYKFPRELKVQYAYSEITVPEGQDPLGTYYMAIGFSEGYFGIQVNGPEERRVLFSIWSPFNTDNPKEIPEDQRIIPLAKGPGVRIGEFGNEGSGGQSFLVYPWKSGKTYRFLIKVTPEADNKTTYTAWFGEKASDQWQLIASFRRPQTNTHLRGFHSFLESFSPTHGYIGRRALFGNQWVCDVDGQWFECTSARFTVDATGNGRHRLDYTGGTEGDAFYLKNCGFFSETGKPGTIFQRPSTAQQKPQINFGDLPLE